MTCRCHSSLTEAKEQAWWLIVTPARRAHNRLCGQATASYFRRAEVCGTSESSDRVGGMSIELSNIDVIAGERSLPGRWTVRRDGELDVSERRPRLMGEGVHAMQWQGLWSGRSVKRW